MSDNSIHSILRVLGELWPHAEGSISKPAPESIYFVPQRTYTSIGSLRDQITYPHVFTEEQHDDEALREALVRARLDYLIDRLPEGFDSVCNWSDLLSPGEKQRLAFSRLFFANKQSTSMAQFVVMDESTSALDVDVEQTIYEELKAQGLTLLSVGHRPTLKKFHTRLVKLDGKGGYSVSLIAAK